MRHRWACHQLFLSLHTVTNADFSRANTPDPALIKAVLGPLLEDFQYWFGRSAQMLKSEEIAALAGDSQRQLLERVEAAQQQVSAMQALFAATGSQAGVDMSLVMTWHQLVQECWQVAFKHRQAQLSPPSSSAQPGSADFAQSDPQLDSPSDSQPDADSA